MLYLDPNTCGEWGGEVWVQDKTLGVSVKHLSFLGGRAGGGGRAGKRSESDSLDLRLWLIFSPHRASVPSSEKRVSLIS